jgi:hypothetical protein
MVRAGNVLEFFKRYLVEACFAMKFQPYKQCENSSRLGLALLRHREPTNLHRQ